MLLKEKSKNTLNNVLNLYNSFQNNDSYTYLNMEEEKEAVLKISEKINDSKFKIAVLGEFSTGKSTIINSFLQQDILPAKYRPTTNQITIIKNSEAAYVREENKLDSTLELSKENVLKINNASNGNIEIGLRLPNLSEYEIYDTPGVNDPSLFSDEIVFDLIGHVDIAIFVLHATQVLKQSEIVFLTQLIRKKDINKFFFIINQSDLIESEKHEVRDDFLERVSSLLNINRSDIEDKTFLYSAKNSLKLINESNIKSLKNSEYYTIINGIDNFIKNNKSDLLNDLVTRELISIIKNSIVKINTAIDKIDGKDKEYENILISMQKEINSFQIEIEDAIYDFRKDFDNQKDIFKINIQQSFDAINTKIVEEVATIPIEKLSSNRYVEIRTKKLVEDATDEEFQRFCKALTLNFEHLNTTIEPIFNERNIVISDLVNKNISSTIVNGIATGAAVIGAITYTPTMATMGAVGIGVSAIGGVASALGPIGMIANGAIGTAGVLAMQAGKFAFNLAKWGVKLIGDYTDKVENIIKIKQYQSSVRTSIDTIKKDILINIDQELNSKTYIEAFIHEKFPQKEEIEKRIDESKKNLEINFHDHATEKSTLEQIKLKLEGSVK